MAVEFINGFNTSSLVVLYIFKGHCVLFFSYEKKLCEARLSVLISPGRNGTVRLGGEVHAPLCSWLAAEL